MGEEAGVTSLATNGTVLARFVVTDIVLDPVCDSEWSDPAQNGHYLALHFNVETTPELAAEAVSEIWISSYDFRVFDTEGKRLNDAQGNAWSCMTARRSCRR